MYFIGILIASFTTCVLVLLFMNVSAYFVDKYASDKLKDKNVDYKKLNIREKIVNLMVHISRIPIAASIYMATVVVLSVFFERH